MSQWIIRSGFKSLTRLYQQDSGDLRVGYEKLFSEIKEIYGYQTAIRLLIEHRSNFVKVQVHKMADKQESEVEKLILGDV